jgi:LysM repeat protein
VEEVRTMPKHAHNRPAKKRRISARGAVVAGAFAALTSVAVAGTAQAAAPAAAKSTQRGAHAAHAWHHSFVKYTVKPGDHLASIARAHKTPGGWHAIARANKLHSPYIIHPGQVLRLPTGGTTASKTAASTSSTTAAPATTGTTKSTATASTAASTTTSTTSSTASTDTSQTYPDNLNGWINHALAIMKQNNIPGSYNGIYRNIMRESSGNPNAINLWDSNAAAGTPSIGLLQVIQPTFDAYHVPGTSENIYDPVANITAACNYAYHVYGSIDNVNGPY